EWRLRELVWEEAMLEGRRRACELVDAVDQTGGCTLQLVRQLLDEVGAAERIGRVGAPSLAGEDLLRSERDPCRAFARQRQRLVERVCVDRLRASAHGGERLNGHASDVVLGLLRGQR